MKTTNTPIRQVLPTVMVASLIAFFTGYVVNSLINRHLIADDGMPLWLTAGATVLAIVGAFALGQRQLYAMWRATFAQEERSATQRRAACLAMAGAAHQAMDDLAETYSNTPDDRLRIRAVYHKDAFAALVGALAAIPSHELDSVDAAVALTGLKKNMRDAQYLIDLYMAWKSDPANDPLFPRPFAQIDLRGCKAYAEVHYRNLVRAIKV